MRWHRWQPWQPAQLLSKFQSRIYRLTIRWMFFGFSFRRWTEHLPKWHIIYFSCQAKFVDNRFKYEDWPRWSENCQRLTTEESIANATNKARYQRFHGGHVIARGTAQKTAKCYDWREAGKIQKYPRCNALWIERITEIGKVPRCLASQIIFQTTKQDAGAQ